MWVEGVGIWNNLVYSDQRNEAMLLAGENGNFWKTDDGWRVAQYEETSAEGYDEGSLAGPTIIDIKDDGERSVDDQVVNFAMDVANVFLTTGSAIVNPFVSLVRNKMREDGDPYVSANPYALKEDEWWEQLDGTKQEVGKEVMKATFGAVFSFVPINLPWVGQFGVQSAASEGVNKAIDSLPND